MVKKLMSMHFASLRLAGVMTGVSASVLAGAALAQETRTSASQSMEEVVVTGRAFRDPSDETATKLAIPGFGRHPGIGR